MEVDNESAVTSKILLKTSHQSSDVTMSSEIVSSDSARVSSKLKSPVTKSVVQSQKLRDGESERGLSEMPIIL